MDLTKMKRIEILADEQLAARLGKLIGEAGFSGHTVMPVLSGSGGRGDWQDERLTASSRVMILCIGTSTNADKLLDKLAPMLTDYRLLLTIGDVEVVRQDRF